MSEINYEKKCKVFERALEQFAKCDLNYGNCASLEVASARIRNLANEALNQEMETENKVSDNIKEIEYQNKRLREIINDVIGLCNFYAQHGRGKKGYDIIANKLERKTDIEMENKVIEREDKNELS